MISHVKDTSVMCQDQQERFGNLQCITMCSNMSLKVHFSPFLRNIVDMPWKCFDMEVWTTFYEI